MEIKKLTQTKKDYVIIIHIKTKEQKMEKSNNMRILTAEDFFEWYQKNKDDNVLKVGGSEIYLDEGTNGCYLLLEESRNTSDAGYPIGGEMVSFEVQDSKIIARTKEQRWIWQCKQESVEISIFARIKSQKDLCEHLGRSKK